MASSGTGATWGITSGTCSMQRDTIMTNTYTVPPAGTVTLRIAHAGGLGQVITSADCKYTVKNVSTPVITSAGEGARALPGSLLAPVFALALTASAAGWCKLAQ